MTVPTPEGVTYGLVVARWLQIVGDTAADPDALPDTKPILGSVLFARKQKMTTRVDSTQTDGTYVGIAKQNINAYLRTVDGELARAADSSDTGVWLVTGVYTVSFSLFGTTWPSFDIEVMTAHTLEAPLDLITATPYVPPTGATPIVIMVPASIPNGYLLAKNGDSVVGVDPATLGGSAPDATTTVKGIAELATLEETVSGTDLVRVTTPAGVKAALDAKALSDMSTYVAPTGTDDRLQVGGVDVEPEQVGAQPAGDYVTTDDAPELIRDTMGSALVAGANVTITPDDGADTFTIAATGGSGGGTTTALWLPGLKSDFVATPASAEFALASSDIRICVTPSTWNGALSKAWAGWFGSSGDRSWQLLVANGYVRMVIYGPDGTTALGGTSGLHGLAARQKGWIRAVVTFDGSGGVTCAHYYSTDGTEWNPNGTESGTLAGSTALFQSATTLKIGHGGSVPTIPDTLFHEFEIRDASDDSVVARWDGSWPHTRQRDAAGNIWTVNGTANAWQEVSA